MRSRTRSRIIVGLVALALLALPTSAPVIAQDPPSVCDFSATGPTEAPLDVDTTTPESGECAIVTVESQPAWRWLDAAIVVGCAAPSGSGTTAQKDGWYLWGITRDDAGAITSQGYVGTSWSGTGCDGTPRVYHGQLWLQGAHRTIELRVERRAWPYSASKVVSTSTDRPFSGTVWIH